MISDYMDRAGRFVLWAAPRVEYRFRSATRLCSVLPRTVVKRYDNQRAYFSRRLSSCVLPGSLLSVLYVPEASCAALDILMASWDYAFCGFIAQLTRNWRRHTRAAWRNEEDHYRLLWQRKSAEHDSGTLDEYLRPLRESFDAFVAEGPRCVHLTYSYASLAVVDRTRPVQRTYVNLTSALWDYVHRSHADAVEQVRARLQAMADRRQLYRHVSEPLMARRRYVRHMRELPLDSWIEWFRCFGDVPMLNVLHGLQLVRLKLEVKTALRTVLLGFAEVAASAAAELAALAAEGRLTLGLPE